VTICHQSREKAASQRAFQLRTEGAKQLFEVRRSRVWRPLVTNFADNLSARSAVGRRDLTQPGSRQRLTPGPTTDH
jgi:hypothetical protein